MDVEQRMLESLEEHGPDTVLDGGGRALGVIPRFLVEREVAHPRASEPSRRWLGMPGARQVIATGGQLA